MRSADVQIYRAAETDGYAVVAGRWRDISALVVENFDFGHAHVITKNGVYIKQRTIQTLFRAAYHYRGYKEWYATIFDGGGNSLLQRIIELGFSEGRGIDIYIKTNTIKSIMRTDSSQKLHNYFTCCSNYTWLSSWEANETIPPLRVNPTAHPTRMIFVRSFFVHDCRPNTTRNNRSKNIYATYAFHPRTTPSPSICSSCIDMKLIFSSQPGRVYRQNIQKSWLVYQINGPFLSPPR